jgi:hypothetical protein
MTRTALFSLALLPLTACNLEVTEVMLSGVVLDQPYFVGSPAVGVEVTSLDGDLVEFSSATSDATGLVELPVAAAQDMFLELRGDGIATTLFAGEAGVFDLALNEGELYTVPDTRAAELAEEFGDCAGDGSGGIIEGEVRIWMPGEETSDISLVGNAWVVAYDEQNNEYPPCYLDENGDPAPEDQHLTNATGRFAIFGVPEGKSFLEVAYRPGGTEDDTEDSELDAFYWPYKVNMVDGAHAPFHPAWVEFGG